MKNLGKLLLLGTGGSMGVPMVGCHCEVCCSALDKNKRLRPSALLIVGAKKILIDCGPDFRTQGLNYKIDHLDGVIITHAHNDHTAGIDDLRALFLKNRKRIPVLLSKDTAADIQRRFYYMFDRQGGLYEGLVAKFELHELPSVRGKVEFCELPIRYVTYEQGGMSVNGFILGNMAYLSDIKHYPETIFEDLAGIKHLVLGALRFTPADLHFNIDEAVDFARKCGASRTYLTHIGHELDHAKGNSYLPEDIEIAYDGLELEFAFS